MIRLLHGNKPVARAIEVGIGVFTPDTICPIGNERKGCRGLGGKLGIDVEHGGASLSEPEEKLILHTTSIIRLFKVPRRRGSEVNHWQFPGRSSVAV